jgi:hypothetical protein
MSPPTAVRPDRRRRRRSPAASGRSSRGAVHASAAIAHSTLRWPTATRVSVNGLHATTSAIPASIRRSPLAARRHTPTNSAASTAMYNSLMTVAPLMTCDAHATGTYNGTRCGTPGPTPQRQSGNRSRGAVTKSRFRRSPLRNPGPKTKQAATTPSSQGSIGCVTRRRTLSLINPSNRSPPSEATTNARRAGSSGVDLGVPVPARRSSMSRKRTGSAGPFSFHRWRDLKGGRSPSPLD